MTKILNVSKSELPIRRPNNGVEEAQFQYQSVHIRKVCAEAETAPQSQLAELAENLVTYVSNINWTSFYTPYEEEFNSGVAVPSVGAWVETSHPVTHVKIEEGRFAQFLKSAFESKGVVVV